MNLINSSNQKLNHEREEEEDEGEVEEIEC